MKTYLPHTLTALLILCCLPVHAQNITLDGTTGPNSGQIQPLTGPNYTIDATQGTTLGSNLYHSFQTFNLFQTESATFTGPTDIRNVVNRVTGGPSSIDGLLQSTMPNANFYFLNPNGVFFGPQASVNVPNSFYVSTSANPQIGEAGALVGAGPAGFQGMPLLTGERAERFGLLDIDVSSLGGEGAKTLGGEGETVTIQGSGSVPSLEVMGKDISVENAKIRAEAENLSFHSSGSLVINDSEIRSSRPNTVIEMTADNLKINRTTETGGPTIRMNAGEEDAGQVKLEARTIEMTDNVNNPTSLLDGSSYGAGKAADFRIIANEQFILRDATIMANTIENAPGKGGTVSILSNNGEVNLSNSSLMATTNGPGKAGNISILGAERVDLEKESLIVASTMSSGDGGVISINTGTLNVTNSAITVGTLSTGKGGNLNIQATQSITLSGASGWSSSRQPQPSSPPASIPLFTIAVDSRNESSGGDATNGQPVVIETPNLELKDGAVISLATFGQGQGGNLEIRADNVSVTDSNIVSGTAASGQGGNIDIYTNALTLSGQPKELLPEFLPGRVFSSIELSTIGDGNAGKLTIGPKSGTPPTVNILNGASISSSSNSTSGYGNAGGLTINAGTVNLNQGTVMAKTVGLGEGGKVRITANQVALDNESKIDVETTGSNKAGNLSITATSEVNLKGKSSITASTEGNGEGGNISLTVNAGNLNVDNQSSISASTKGEKPAGRLGITANEVNLTGNSLINAATFGQGRGGDLNVEANKLSVTNSNIIAATGTGGGEAGKVEIRTADMSLSGRGSHPILQEYPRSDSEPYSTIEVSTAGTGNAGSLTIGPKQGGPNPTLTLNNNASISASTLPNSSGPAGNLTITANQVSLDNSTIKSSTAGQGKGGNLTMTASDVSLNNGAAFSAKADREAIGNAGTLSITATGAISTTNSQISTESYQSQGGDIQLRAAGLTVTDNGQVKADIDEKGSKGGNIDIQVDNLGVANGGQITSSTKGGGTGGNVSIQASNYVSVGGSGSQIQSETSGSGPAGHISLTTPQLSLTQAGKISTAATNASASGNSGSVTINNVKTLNMTENASITATSDGGGNAGAITINNPNQKAEQVTLNDSRITTEAQGGAGGSIAINAQQLTVQQGEINAKVKQGRSGATPANIDLNAGQLNLQEANIESSTEGEGPAGKIAITATEYLQLTGGEIKSEANSSGPAGEITIGTAASPVPRLQLSAGEISTTAHGPSDSGSITIYANEVQVPPETKILSENFQGRTGGTPANITMKVDRLDLAGEIKSSTHGSSPGGEISITASDYIAIAGGNILSTANANGDAGHIKIGNESQWVPKMTVTGGEVSATASGSSNSGTVDLFVTNLQADNGSIKSASQGQGNPNAIPAQVNVTTGNVTLANGSEIKTSTEGASPAGSVTVTAGQKVDISNSNVVSESTGTADKAGRAGEVTIIGKNGKPVPELVLNGGKDNQTISTTAKGPGQSGTIALYVDRLTVSGGASIKSESKDYQGTTLADITLDVKTLTVGGDSGSGTISTSTVGKSQAGNITITASEYVGIFGEKSGIASDSAAGATGPAGTIAVIVNGDTNKEEALTIKGGKISTNTSGSGNAGNITVVVENNKTLKIDGQGKVDDKGKPSSGVFSASLGKPDDQAIAGTITIGNTNQPVSTIDLSNKGQISTASYTKGDSGDVKVYVDTLTLFGGSSISAESNGTSEQVGDSAESNGTSKQADYKAGKAGKVTIQKADQKADNQFATKKVEVSDSKITTQTQQGEGGEISIQAEEVTVKEKGSINAKVKDNATTPAGITINSNNLTLNGGGRIESSTEGNGNAGVISITASDYIAVSGVKMAVTEEQSGIFSTTSGNGNAGTITLGKDKPVPTITLSNEGQISTATISQGQGGTMDIKADQLTVNSGGVITAKVKDVASQEDKSTANIDVAVTNQLFLQGGGRIESSTTGTRGAGTITVTANQVEVSGQSSDKSKSSGIFSTSGTEEVSEVTGQAGTITIGKTDQRVSTINLSDNGQISTQSFDKGAGGSVTINANDLTVTNGNINAKVANGQDPEDETAKNAKVANGQDPKNETAPAKTKSTANIDVTVTNQLSLQGGGRIESSTTGTRGAGTITVAANQVEVSGQSPDKSKSSGLFSTSGESNPNASGAAGKILLAGEKLNDNVSLQELQKARTVASLTVKDNGEISTTSYGTGEGGEIKIQADNLAVMGGSISAKSDGTGRQDAKPANITLMAKTVTLGSEQDRNQVGRIVSSTAGDSNAGQIVITASDYITIFGSKEKNDDNRSGVFSTASGGQEGNRKGNAGQINILAGKEPRKLTLVTRNLQESLSEKNESQLTDASGGMVGLLKEDAKLEAGIPGGDCQTKNGCLTLTGGKISTSTTGQGSGGDIRIAAGELQLVGGTEISASATPSGNVTPEKAGNIIVGTNRLDMSNSTLSTTSTGAKKGGGNILIGVREINNRRISNSQITASATKGEGQGGNIEITGGRNAQGKKQLERLYLDNTDVTAKAEGGPGGNLYIKPEVFIASADSEISASSEKGIDGEVQTGMTVDVSALTLFPNVPADASKLIKDCTAAGVGEGWSLVPVGSKTKKTETGQLPPVQEGLRLSLYDARGRQTGGCLR